MIRIGVYGLGKISYRVIQGILYANNADLYAVCSSNLEKANAFKEEYGARKAYDSYEEMLQDANLDMDIFVHRIICMRNIFKWL